MNVRRMWTVEHSHERVRGGCNTSPIEFRADGCGITSVPVSSRIKKRVDMHVCELDG